MKTPMLLISLTCAFQVAAGIAFAGTMIQGGTSAGNSKRLPTKSQSMNRGTPHGWYSYSAADGTYGIAFPGKPIDRSQTEQTELGPVQGTIKMYATANSRRQYYLMVGKHNIDSRSQNVEKSLDFGRDTALKRAKGVLVNESRLNYHGVIGRQYTIAMPDGGKAKFRVFLVTSGAKPISYSAFVGDHDGKVEDADVDRFMRSLNFKPK